MKLRILTLGLASAMLAACGGGNGGAQDSQVLNVYNYSDYIAEDTIPTFEKESGIKVTYDVFDSDEMVETKLLAGNSGYDLIFPGDTVAERLMRAGALQKLDKSKLTALADVEPGLQRLQTKYPYSRHAVVPYTWGSIGITYNAAQIQQRLADAVSKS